MVVIHCYVSGANKNKMTDTVLVLINGVALLVNVAIYLWAGKPKFNLFCAVLSLVVMLCIIA